MGPYEIAMLISSIVLILGSIALVVIVLIQSNSAKGLSGAIAGGSETYFGKNKKKSIEKKLLIITIVVAIVFSALSLVVSSFQKNASIESENQLEQLKKEALADGWDLDHNGKVSDEEYEKKYMYDLYVQVGLPTTDPRVEAHKNCSCNYGK